MISPSDIKLLKVGEVAKMLNVSVSAIYKWTQAGDFPAPYKLGDKKKSTARWSEAEVIAWLSAKVGRDG
jgi:excisionase family DNA binding protein